MTVFPHPPVLALDLSTTRGTIAVTCAGETRFETSFTAERSHNAQVFAPLGEALDVIGQSPAVIVVGTGPGSYTGVRIAIAAAQGVALSRGWPLIGWPSIATAAEADYQVIGDARRGHFYTTTISQRSLDPITILDADSARAQVEAGGVWRSFDTKVPLDLPQVQLCQPSASRLGQIVSALDPSEISRLAASPLEPLYLQEAFITVAKKAGKAVPRK